MTPNERETWDHIVTLCRDGQCATINVAGQARSAAIVAAAVELQRLQAALDANICPECERIDEEDAWEEVATR
jgi:hypothetical protein